MILDLIKKLLFVTVITFFSTRIGVQVILTSLSLAISALLTLVMSPYRSRLCNYAEGLLSLFASITILIGWLTEVLEELQSILVIEL